ncbi:3-methyl-2-oxobutanoate hydroxymethyltransferase [Thiohalophilus sp.]|uniref:3-methyl-2-oxobutanoate hydroxymethyltransferase n=1 Tax=Thiohalophilus sp. TaxID=3028392 RepID=UPI0039759E7F
MSPASEPALTVEDLRVMKQRGEKIAVLTAYDASMTSQCEQAGVDVLLVGDSLGMVVQGHDSTRAVNMADMIYHTSHVARARQRALLIADMPYQSYAHDAGALENGRALLGAGADMVKLEGGGPLLSRIRHLVDNGVPVCGHLGLLPQSVVGPEGYRVQGREAEAARQMIEDALALEQAGAALLVLECIPRQLAIQITESVSIPTIGIGAGAGCDGQVLVIYDLLGITPGKRPRFVRDFLREAGPGKGIQEAIAEYVRQVKSGEFPQPSQSYQ